MRFFDPMWLRIKTRKPKNNPVNSHMEQQFAWHVEGCTPFDILRDGRIAFPLNLSASLPKRRAFVDQTLAVDRWRAAP